MSENRVLRRIFETKRDEVTGKWRKLQNGESRNLYSSPNTMQIISRRMRWEGHVARMGEGREVYQVLVGKCKRKNHPKDQEVDGMGPNGS
jgi:hypothetical protein